MNRKYYFDYLTVIFPKEILPLLTLGKNLFMGVLICTSMIFWFQ